VVFPASQAVHLSFFHSGEGFGHSSRDRMVLKEICTYLLCKSRIWSSTEIYAILGVPSIHIPPWLSLSTWYTTFLPILMVAILPRAFISWSPSLCPLMRLLKEGLYKHSLCPSTFPLCTNSSIPFLWHVDFLPPWASTGVLISCISRSRSNWLVVWWEVPVSNWNDPFLFIPTFLLLSHTRLLLPPHFHYPPLLLPS